jgi:rhodanese-related sulfurtransferase
MKTINAEVLHQQIEQGNRFQLIDVRSPGEYAAGHLPCAVNLPMDQVEARLDDVHHRDPVVLVCRTGRRATLTGNLLRPHLNELLVLDGGTGAWTHAGLPLVRSTVARWSLERQVRLIAGLLVLAGSAAALGLHVAWVFVPLMVGAGLTFAGLTDSCGMAFLLARMPWNRARAAADATGAGSCAAPATGAPR